MVTLPACDIKSRFIPASDVVRSVKNRYEQDLAIIPPD